MSIAFASCKGKEEEPSNETTDVTEINDFVRNLNVPTQDAPNPSEIKDTEISETEICTVTEKTVSEEYDEKFSHRSNGIIVKLAKLTMSIYCLHWPLIKTLSAIKASNNFINQSLLVILFCIMILLAFYIHHRYLHYLAQKNQPHNKSNIIK